MEIEELTSRAVRGANGIWTLKDSVCGLGGVLFAEREGSFVVVRKAVVGSYDFAGLLALPGGMVRSCDGDETFKTAALSSLCTRVEAEAGIARQALSELHRIENIGPVVTKYSAHGRVRHTLISTHAAVVTEPMQTAYAKENKSVDAAYWQSRTVDWPKFAPGNRVILAWLLWARLSASERAEARPSVSVAVEQCSAWASEVGLSPCLPPWTANEAA